MGLDMTKWQINQEIQTAAEGGNERMKPSSNDLMHELWTNKTRRTKKTITFVKAICGRNPFGIIGLAETHWLQSAIGLHLCVWMRAVLVVDELAMSGFGVQLQSVLLERNIAVYLILRMRNAVAIVLWIAWRKSGNFLEVHYILVG